MTMSVDNHVCSGKKIENRTDVYRNSAIPMVFTTYMPLAAGPEKCWPGSKETAYKVLIPTRIRASVVSERAARIRSMLQSIQDLPMDSYAQQYY